MDTVKSRVRAIRLESELLSQYVNRLPEQSLNHPSACSMWDVGDVIAHLIWFMENYNDFLVSRALQGDLSPVPDQPEGHAVADLDAYHATRAILRRSDLGSQLREKFSTLVEGMNATFEARRKEDWEKPMRMLSGMHTVATVLDLNIQEFPLHGWDIRSRLEGSANLLAESVSELMNWIPKRFRMPWFVEFLPDSPLEAPAIFRFHIPQAGTDLTVVDNRLEISTAAETKADVEFQCDAETFVLLMYKRITLREASEHGRLVANGDDHLIAGFDRWLKR